MRIYRIFISICVFFSLCFILIYAQTPVLYPNFPLIIGPSPNFMLPLFGSILAHIDTISGSEVILHLGDGSLHVWDYRGNSLSGFPKAETPFVYGGTSVGDLNGDGKNEIVNITLEGLLDVIDFEGNSLPNFPVWTPSTHTSAPVLADLDKDGYKEIIFYRVWGKEIYVYKTDGTIYPGWPKVINSLYPGFIRGTPAVGDLDGDGYQEIIAFAFDSAYVWGYTGDLLPGWPRAPIDTIYTQYMDDGPPLLADLDKDGKLEILAVRFRGESYYFGKGALDVYNRRGEIIPGWPGYFNRSPLTGPVIADVDIDGSLEIVISTIDSINILKANGNILQGWRIDNRWLYKHQLISADLDYNDTLEILLIGEGNFISGSPIFAYSLDGKLFDGYPFYITGIPAYFTPTVADVDYSDSLALLVVSLWGEGDPPKHYAYIYLFDLGVPYDPSSVQWGTYGHNNRRTNNYHDSDICNAKPGDANKDTVVGFSDIIKIIDYLFRSDTLSTPKCAYDPNFDRKIKLSDAVFLINYLFKSGIPPIPYDDCCPDN